MSTPPSSPNKFRKLTHAPPQETPKKQVFTATTVDLEYTKNPQTGELTDNMRLTVILKAGIKDPKGFMESAWNGANLREKHWSVSACLSSPASLPSTPLSFRSFNSLAQVCC